MKEASQIGSCSIDRRKDPNPCRVRGITVEFNVRLGDYQDPNWEMMDGPYGTRLTGGGPFGGGIGPAETIKSSYHAYAVG